MVFLEIGGIGLGLYMLLGIAFVAFIWMSTAKIAWDYNPDDRKLHVPLAVFFGPFYLMYFAWRGKSES